MSIHISISTDPLPADAEIAQLQQRVKNLLLKYTSPEAAAYAAERIAKGVTMDMETFTPESASRILNDLHAAGLRAAIVSEQ